MNKTYHITMDDGEELHLRASSASEAIGSALEKHRLHKVVACYAGNENMTKLGAGRIDYEIPEHEPLPAEEISYRGRGRERLPDDHPSKRPAPWIEEWLEKKGAKRLESHR